MNSRAVDLIVPTLDNRPYLQPCLTSLVEEAPSTRPVRVLVVNNGSPASCDWIAEFGWPRVEVLQAGGHNLGWEGGLNRGLAASNAPLVVFCNDDILIPTASRGWIDRLAAHFADDRVGAAGPASNMVMGAQSIFAAGLPPVVAPRFLIGFCVMVQRTALDAVGGIDATLPGGDDFDLGVRLRAAGYRLIADRRVFVYHHGFRTGERLHGTADRPGGWNSAEMQAATKQALIRKHGAAVWDDAMSGAWDEEPAAEPPPWIEPASFNPLDHPAMFDLPERIAPSAWIEHIPFAMFAVSILRPRTIVELGVHHGVSYCAFCQTARRLDLDIRCTGVDTWAGDEQSGYYGPEVLADLRGRHDPRYGDFSELLTASFDDARDRFADGSIDLLHLDGCHAYERVAHDFREWLPKMSERGVILLHDIAVRLPDFGVWRLWAEIEREFRSFAFHHGHGLGVVFLGAEPGPLERALTGDSRRAAATRAFFHRLGQHLQRDVDRSVGEQPGH